MLNGKGSDGWIRRTQNGRGKITHSNLWDKKKMGCPKIHFSTNKPNKQLVIRKGFDRSRLVFSFKFAFTRGQSFKPCTIWDSKICKCKLIVFVMYIFIAIWTSHKDFITVLKLWKAQSCRFWCDINVNRKQFVFVPQISTLLGFTWFFGFIAGFANINVLWYIFIILNSLQGFYIFLAFMANRRVAGMWISLCHGNVSGISRRSRGTSSVPLSQRTTSSRLTSISSLPRGDERAPNGDRRHSGEKSAWKPRYSGVSQKISESRRTSGDRGTSGGNRGSLAEDRRNSGGDRGSPGEERRYSHGEWRQL